LYLNSDLSFQCSVRSEIGLEVNTASREFIQAERQPVFPLATGSEEANLATVDTKRWLIEHALVVSDFDDNFAVVVNDFHVHLLEVPVSLVAGMVFGV